jgi:hypothetical protein
MRAKMAMARVATDTPGKQAPSDHRGQAMSNREFLDGTI